MSWSYEVETELVPKNFSTTLTLSVFGGVDTNVDLDFLPNAEKKSVVKGGIEYECKKSEFHIEGRTTACVMYDLKRDSPMETTSISAALLKDNVPKGLSIGPLKVKATLKQPSVKVSPSMQVTASNENQCYNVFVEVTAEFIPGSVDFTIDIPTPIPGLKNSAVGRFRPGREGC